MFFHHRFNGCPMHFLTFVLLFPILSVCTVWGQTLSTHQLAATTPSSVKLTLHPVSNANGDIDLIGNVHFGFDSSYTALLRMDTALNRLSGNTYKLPFSRSNVRTVIRLSDGYILGGFLSGNLGGRPWLMRVDNTFQVVWQRIWTNTPLGSYQFHVGFLNGNDLTFYLGEDTRSDVLLRLKTDINGTLFDFKEITNTPLDELGLYGGMEMGPDRHIIYGTVTPNGTNNKNGFVSYFDIAGHQWTRMLDFGINIEERVTDVIRLSDGDLLTTLTHYDLDSTKYLSYLCKMDTTGTIQWCKRLLMNGGGVNVRIEYAIELNNGDLLFTAVIDNFERCLIKTDNSGNLLWTRVWNNPTPGIVECTGLFKNPDGTIWLSLNVNDYFLVELDEDGIGCNFYNDMRVNAVDFSTYQASNLNYVISTVIGVSDTGYVETRNMLTSTSTLCDTTIGPTRSNLSEEQSIKVYPTVASDILVIDGALENPGTVEIYNSSGILELKCRLQKVLDISLVSSGLKFIRVIQNNKSYNSQFVKTKF